MDGLVTGTFLKFDREVIYIWEELRLNTQIIIDWNQ